MNRPITKLSATSPNAGDLLTVNSLGRQVTISTKEVIAMSLQSGETADTTRLTILMFGTILIDVLAPDAAVAFHSLKTVGVREVPSMSGLPANSD
ncbi:MAG: hypothetical protein R3F19_13150 [Verrucomicrobiales bacterium]